MSTFDSPISDWRWSDLKSTPKRCCLAATPLLFLVAAAVPWTEVASATTAGPSSPALYGAADGNGAALAMRENMPAAEQRQSERMGRAKNIRPDAILRFEDGRVFLSFRPMGSGWYALLFFSCDCNPPRDVTLTVPLSDGTQMRIAFRPYDGHFLSKQRLDRIPEGSSLGFTVGGKPQTIGIRGELTREKG